MAEWAIPGDLAQDVSTTTAPPANGVEQSPRLKRSNLMAATAAELEQLRRLKPDSRLLVPIKAGQASRLRLLGYDSIGYYDDLRSLDAVEFMDLLIPYDGSDDREKNAAVIAAARSVGTIHTGSRVSISPRSTSVRTLPTIWKRRCDQTPSRRPRFC